MALVLKDRVKETTATTSTGTYTLAGAVVGYQSFSVIGNANTTYYACTNGTDWEVGIGTYTASGTTLSRDTILESSNSGNAVNWGAGVKDIFCTYPAERSMYVDGTTITPATAASLAVVSGGTGQTSYVNGELLIGNTTGNTLAKATLTAGTGIAITNGAGTISIAATNNGTVTSVATGTGLTGGPITTTGTVSVATNGITNTLLRQSAGLSVVGRSASTTGDVADVTAATDNQVLRRSGTAIGFGAVNLASTDAVTGDLPFSNLAQGSALSVLGVTGNATADVASIAAGTDHQVLRRSGTTVAFGAVNLAQAAAITGTLPVGNGGTGITSFGTGVATWLGTPSSANLAAAVTDETGSGALVFAASPTFTGTVTTAAIAMADNLLTRSVLQDYAVEGSAIGNTGGTRTLDLTVANFFSATLNQACTFTFSNPPASGDFGTFVLELTNGGAFAITWPASVDWPGGSAPTLTASGKDQLVFTTRDGGTIWFGFVAGKDIK